MKFSDVVTAALNLAATMIETKAEQLAREDEYVRWVGEHPYEALLSDLTGLRPSIVSYDEYVPVRAHVRRIRRTTLL